MISNNYPGAAPAGVTQLGNDLGIRGEGQNTWNPRVGFAWQIPPSQRIVLRGGYGIYHQRVTGQPLIQLLLNQPFGMLRQFVAFGNSAASFANPFPPGIPTFPSFTPYSPALYSAPQLSLRIFVPLSFNATASTCRPNSRKVWCGKWVMLEHEART